MASPAKAYRSQPEDCSPLMDAEPICIPTSAFTLNGFRKWAHSGNFPRTGRVSYWDSSVHITDWVEMETIHVPGSAASLEGFSAWREAKGFPQRGRITFLGMEIIIDMSPEELDSHNQVKGEVSRVIMNLVRENQLGRFYSDGAGVKNAAADLSNEPDGVFAFWDSFKNQKVRQAPSRRRPGSSIDLEGTPDWVMEVVSRYSVKKDTKNLVRKYHRAGIPEYWLIDARGERISFQILQHRPSGYVPAARRGGWVFSKVFGRGFRLERERHPLGPWIYTLHVKNA